MPRKMVTEMTENLTIQGVVPLTPLMLNEQLSTFRNDIRNDLMNQLSIPSSVTRQENQQIISETNSLWGSWNWGGKICVPFPPDFKFTKGSSRVLWMYWFFGDEDRRIRPYRYFKESDFPIATSDQTLLIKARGVIKVLVQISIFGELIASVDDLYSMNKVQSLEIFDLTYEFLIEAIRLHYVGSRKRRYGDIHYSTIYEDIHKYGISFN